jgi:uncharacterized protein YbbC (DUF1343 family)
LKIRSGDKSHGQKFVGRQTIDVLKEAKNVKLVALFSPEHGIRGQLDQEKDC